MPPSVWPADQVAVAEEVASGPPARPALPNDQPSPTTSPPQRPAALPNEPALPLNPAVAEALKGLGLTTLAKVVPTVLETARQEHQEHQEPWSYATLLQQAVGTELAGRAERAYQRRVRAAHRPSVKSLEGFDCAFQPSLSTRLLNATPQRDSSRNWGPSACCSPPPIACCWGRLLGPPGVGKPHLALAFTARALEAGYSARFTTLPQLADELETTSWRQQRRRYLTPRLLVIDEVGYLRLTTGQAHQLFDLVTARSEQAPIILTSNRSFAQWGTLLGDEVLATALLDRLLHHAEVITINGQSYRLNERRLNERRLADPPRSAEAAAPPAEQEA